MDIQTGIATYCDEMRLKRSANTARTYGGCLKKFTEYLQQKYSLTPTDDLHKITIEQFINAPYWILSQDYRRKSVLVYIAAVKTFLDWLVIQNYILPDYQASKRIEMAFHECYRRHEDHLIRTPKNGEVEKMIQAASQKNYSASAHPEAERARNIALIRFLASSGCRNNEARSLRIRDIDLQECQALVLGKGNKERFVFFDRATADALHYYWGIRGFAGQSDPAFARHDRGSTNKNVPKKIMITTNTVRNIVSDCMKVAGIEKGSFSPHYFRHAFAIKMLRETGNLALVQDLLGHADPKSTRVYAKIDKEELQEAHRRAFN